MEATTTKTTKTAPFGPLGKWDGTVRRPGRPSAFKTTDYRAVAARVAAKAGK